MKKLLCLVLACAALLLPQKVQSCTIPVFRYALEKWELTPYEILVYHRGPLPADVEKALKKWEADAPKNANIEITLIDLDKDVKLTKAQEKLWANEGDPKQTPWMIVRYAAADPAEPSAWRGPCTLANLNGILDSPMRRAVLSHLTHGATTVWVVLTSDDAQKDRAAFDLLTKELQTLEKKIKLPVQSDTGPQIKLPISLKVFFPILVLDRKSAEEAGFIRLLLGTEDRLADKKGPILFPIFGRGRVLGSLVEKEISEDQILSVSQFLCRECSCQVKELNPGIDLLMVAHWNDAFDKLYDGKVPFPMPKLAPSPLFAPEPVKNEVKPIEVRVGAEGAVASKGFTLSTSPVIEATLPVQANRTPFDLRFLLWLGIGVASGLVLLSGGWVVYQVRK